MINIDAKSYEGKKFRHEDIELIRFSVQNVFEEMRSGCWKLIVSNLANPNQLYAMFGRGKVSEGSRGSVEAADDFRKLEPVFL